MKKAAKFFGVLMLTACLAVTSPVVAQTPESTTTTSTNDRNHDNSGKWGLAGLLGLLGLLGLRGKDDDRRRTNR